MSLVIWSSMFHNLKKKKLIQCSIFQSWSLWVAIIIFWIYLNSSFLRAHYYIKSQDAIWGNNCALLGCIAMRAKFVCMHRQVKSTMTTLIKEREKRKNFYKQTRSFNQARPPDSAADGPRHCSHSSSNWDICNICSELPQCVITSSWESCYHDSRAGCTKCALEEETCGSLGRAVRLMKESWLSDIYLIGGKWEEEGGGAQLQTRWHLVDECLKTWRRRPFGCACEAKQRLGTSERRGWEFANALKRQNSRGSMKSLQGFGASSEVEAVFG